MSLSFAILGILKTQPMSGYDIKKKIQDSIYLYWSGNNNQIYKVLSELTKEEFVTFQKHEQESLPSKKVYTITEKGLAALNEWATLSMPELPVFKNPFLIQLLCSDGLSDGKIQELLLEYQRETQIQLKMQQEWMRRDHNQGSIMGYIYDNVIRFYQSEIDWTQSVLERIACTEEEDNATKQ